MKNRTMSKLKFILPLTVLSFGSTTAHAAAPTPNQALQWLVNPQESSADPIRAITFTSSAKFTMVGGEEAYISGVEFKNAARNFWGGYILIRPKIQQSKILTDFGGQANGFKVFNTHYKGTPLDVIQLKSAGSGQGSVEGSTSLVIFKGNQVQVLASQNTGSFGGFYDEKTDAEDCKTGHDNDVFFNVMEYTPMIVKTTTSANGCEHLKSINYKVKTDLIPIVIK